MVVGRIADTTKFAGEAGHQVLKVPRQSPTWMWNIDVNDGWMHRGIAEGRKFLLATKPSMSSLRSVRTLDDGTVVRDFTVYFRELKMLRNAGYVQRKMPNGQIMMVPGS